MSSSETNQLEAKPSEGTAADSLKVELAQFQRSIQSFSQTAVIINQRLADDSEANRRQNGNSIA